MPLRTYLADGKVGPAWQAVFVPLADLGAGTALSRTLSVYWQGGTVQQPRMYIQGVTLAALPLPAARKPPPSPSPSPSPKPSPSPSPSPSPAPGPLPTHPYSLYTQGAAIKWKNGTRFSGRGCNVRCWCCSGGLPVAQQLLGACIACTLLAHMHWVSLNLVMALQLRLLAC